jgi:hypothetical protein
LTSLFMISTGDLVYNNTIHAPITVAEFSTQFINYTGLFTVVQPSGGCVSIKDVPSIACLIERNEKCTFLEKAFNAEFAGCTLAIVYDNIDENLIIMGGGSGQGITIPVIFISEKTGLSLLELTNTSIITITSTESLFLEYYVLFEFVIAFSLVLIIFLFTCILCKNWIAVYRSRLEHHSTYSQLSNVNTIDNTSWMKKNKTYTYQQEQEKKQMLNYMDSDGDGDSMSLPTCSVCLQPYVVGCYNRRLICGHNFHQLCIDKWFLVNLRCPLCNHDPRVNNL